MGVRFSLQAGPDTRGLLQKYAQKHVRPWNAPLVEKAFELSQLAHRGQRRETGEAFIEHPMTVARLVAQLECDLNTFLAALLHDAVEDGPITHGQVLEVFGPDVAFIVDSLTKLTEAERLGGRAPGSPASRENLRKILAGSGKDLRVAYIKLADRLHNLATSQPRPRGKVNAAVQETVDYFIPLARELSIAELQRKLEFWSLQLTNARLFDNLANIVKANERERAKQRRQVRDKIEPNLRELLIRHDYIEPSPEESVLALIPRQPRITDENVGDLADLTPPPKEMLILLDSASHCYVTLGIIHSLWPPVFSLFRDWIGDPMGNGYRALHTVVQIGENDLLTFRLQTREMRRHSERGPLHSLRDSESQGFSGEHINSPVLRGIEKLHHATASTQEFLDKVRMDLLPPKIRIFPKGRPPMDVPQSSTVLDLVCCQDLVDSFRVPRVLIAGRLVPVRHRLQDGDLVELDFEHSAPLVALDANWSLGTTHVTAAAEYLLRALK